MRVLFAGQLIAQTSAAYRILETSHPPTWYIPLADIRMEFLSATKKTSVCEWKGVAKYWTIRVGDQFAENAAWSYNDHIAFYPSKLECYVDDERVEAQAGDFYGGWITRDIVGPFKGGPGTWGW